MSRNLVVGIVVCSLVQFASLAATAGDHKRFTASQEILRNMVAAYGGAERLSGLESVSFQTSSTYFAFHQSLGVSGKWDPQPQQRHYAIDFVSETAAFGRDMEEWSFHDKYGSRRHYRFDNEREIFTQRDHAGVETLAHIIIMNPALVARDIFRAPYHLRVINPPGKRGQDDYDLIFADLAGQFVNIIVDSDTWLINELHFVSSVEPFGDVSRSVYFSDYVEVDGIATPTVVRSGIMGEIEFDHHLDDVEYNKSIEKFSKLPDGYLEINANSSEGWTIKTVATGVHVATNGDYNIPLLEFEDHLIAYNASRRFSDVLGALQAAADRFSNKPVKRVVLSHHHFDRAGAVGAYAAHNISLSAADKYEERVASFVEDRMIAAAGKPSYEPAAVKFHPISDGDEIRDSTNVAMIFDVPNNAEAETLFVIYLPRQRILIHDGDLFRKYAEGPLRRRRAGSAALEKFILDKKLDVDHLVGNRGVTATLEDLRQTNTRPPLRRNGNSEE